MTQAEGGEAGQVDRGGQQLEVLGDPDQAAHPGAPAAVAAAQQVGELALDLPTPPNRSPPFRRRIDRVSITGSEISFRSTIFVSTNTQDPVRTTAAATGNWVQTKALRPVMARPTIRVFISRVPS